MTTIIIIGGVIDKVDWSFSGLWNSMNFLARGIVVLLVVMLLQSAVIVLNRYIVVRLARRQTRKFLNRAIEATVAGRLYEIVALAKSYRWSHVARVLACGVETYLTAPAELDDERAISSASHAMRRSSVAMRAELRVGLGTLATIGSTTPYFGLLGTVVGILNCFRGSSGSAATGLGLMAEGIAEALVTTAVGLTVAVPATWMFNYFVERTQIFDTEMKNAALELVTWLRQHPEIRASFDHSKLEKRDTANVAWEIAYERQFALLAPVLLFGLYLLYQLASATYLSYHFWH